MKHEVAHENLRAYVYGELDASKTDALERHLDSGCAACVERLLEIQRESLSEARLAPQHDPPPHVRDTVMKRVRTHKPTTSRRMGIGGVLGWATAVISVAALVGMLVWTGRLQEEIGNLQSRLDSSRDRVAQLESDVAVFQQTQTLLGRRCARVMDLAGVDPNADAFGKVMLDPDEKVGMIYVYRMPEPPEGMAYQLWMMIDDKPVGMGMFTVRDDGSAVFTLQKLPDTARIAEFEVTIEPAEGTSEPTGMQYLAGANVFFGVEHEHTD